MKDMKGCIFDLDGTLGDTRASLVHSVGLTLKEMGLPGITDKACISFVGNGARYLIEKSLEASSEGSSSRIEEAMEIYGRVFDRNCTYQAEPYEGIEEMLSEMKSRGIKLSVLSNKPHEQTVKVVHAMFGEEMFMYIQGQTEGIPRKPDPEGIYRALQEMGISPGECLYVGDSEVDITTGKRAGIKTVSVSWGFRSKEELKLAEPEYIIDKAEELLKFV